jgi:long-chain acyl-CoA synthetase
MHNGKSLQAESRARSVGGIAQDDWPNLVTLFFRQADRLGERPLLWRKQEGRYVALTWREVDEQVCSLARGLRALGLSIGDRVVLVSENRPEWLISDLAVMAAGAVTVPAYITNAEADHLHILDNSGASALIVSTHRLAERILPAAMRCSSVRFVVVMENPGLRQQPDFEVVTWREAMKRGEGDNADVRANTVAIARDQTACIIYTSGTGGAPKGVMLHHGAILNNVSGAIEVLSELGLGDDVFLSFLPLSHAYEHTIGQFLPIAMGAEIYYAESVDRVVTNICEARPTLLTAVPRFYEILQERIMYGARKQGGLSRRLFEAALAVGRRRQMQPHDVDIAGRVLDPLFNVAVRNKIRSQFGGRLKAMISGGAPLNPEVAIFFRALGLPLFQGYGQTEAGPLISVNRPSRPKLHGVGPPIKGAEVRIADDGEILVRGELVMQGYWRNERATREAIRDGWLHTGDIGEIDADGHILITDRKKDLIVNSGGDNLSPARIEGLLTLRPEIAQALVYGDRRPHLVALLVPSPEWMGSWAQSSGKPAELAALAADPEFLKALGGAVDKVNRRLSSVERIRRFAVASEPFTIENEQLTPTMKIRRHVITRTYATTLAALYE